MKKIIAIGIIFLSFISCKDENKHIKPKNIFIPSDEISQVIKNAKAEVLFELSKGFYESRNYNKAIGLLSSALLLEKNPIIYNELGIINMTIENYDEAIKQYKLGQQIDTTYYPNFINEAYVHMRLKEFDIAESILTNIINESKSEYWKAYSNLYLAALYFNNGNQCNKSIEFLSKAESIKSDLNLKKMYKDFEKTIKNYCS